MGKHIEDKVNSKQKKKIDGTLQENIDEKNSQNNASDIALLTTIYKNNINNNVTQDTSSSINAEKKWTTNNLPLQKNNSEIKNTNSKNLYPLTINKKRSKKARIWDQRSNIIDYTPSEEDGNVILREFIKKTEILNANEIYHEDWTKDTYIRQHYNVERLDLTSFRHIKQLHESFHAKQLRLYSLELLKYARKNKQKVKELIEAYETEIDKREAACIKEIIKLMEKQVFYINHIRDLINEFTSCGEEAIMHYGKYIEML